MRRLFSSVLALAPAAFWAVLPTWADISLTVAASSSMELACSVAPWDNAWAPLETWSAPLETWSAAVLIWDRVWLRDWVMLVMES